MKKNIIRNLNSIFVSFFIILTIIPIMTNGILETKNNILAFTIFDTHSNIFNMKHRFPERYIKQDISYESYIISNYQNNHQTSLIKTMSTDNSLRDSAWPMYCHDTKHTGRSPYNTADNPMTEKWRYPMDGYSHHSAPVLDNEGTVYVANSHIYALYPNGSLKWEFAYGSPVEGGPAIDEQQGVLYYGIEWDSPNYIYALYLSNGSTKWKYPVSGDITSSPAIDSFGNIYFGDWNGDIHAVYPDGTRKWMYHTGDVITSSPAIDDDGVIYIGSHDYFLYAFYPNGTVKWRFQTGGWIHGSPTIGSDGTIYIGSDDGYLYALTDNGSMIWRCPIGYTWCSPTLGSDGILYLGVWQMKFYAIYPNGTIKWTYNAPGRIWFGSSAALSDDDILYFGTAWADGGEGAFVALNSYDGSERFFNSYGDYKTSPAISSDGTIYAVTLGMISGEIHSFGLNGSKTITIIQPKEKQFYLFGLPICPILKNDALVIGLVTVKIDISSVEELYNISFYIDNKLQFVDTQPPFEWNMDQRFGNQILMNHQLTVVGYFTGGCYSSESINIRYLHLLKN